MKPSFGVRTGLWYYIIHIKSSKKIISKGFFKIISKGFLPQLPLIKWLPQNMT